VEGKFFELAYCSTITATRGLVEEDRVVERLRVSRPVEMWASFAG
jgi:hypothetical protein